MKLGKSRRRYQKFVPPKLQITSMMDMFTIILIFLLLSFSDTQDNLNLDKDLELPVSTAKLNYKDNMKLILSQKELRLGDEVIARLEGNKIIGLDPERPKESTLYRRLIKYRKRDESAIAEGTEKAAILFLCDKRLSFKTINNVVKTSGMAGYPNFQFGVLKK